MTSRHQIYFARRGDGLIKIGTTYRLPQRIAHLQKSHGLLEVIRVIHGDRQREREIHRQFRSFHEYGEWFRNDGGELLKLIRLLEPGTAIEVTADDSRADWKAGEAKLMAKARQFLDEMVRARMFIAGVKRAEAQEAITEEYGFSPWFLENVRRRNGATSITAYGMQKIREAWVSEKTAQIDFLKSEMSDLEHDVALLAAKVAAKKAAVRLKTQG